MFESAPIDALTLLHAKRRWGLPPILCIGVGLCIGAGIITELTMPLLVMSVLITAAYTWTVCSMGTYLGAFDPQFNLDNPARVASSMTAVVFMLSSMLLLICQLALSLQPLWVFERYISQGRPPTWTSLGLSVLLITIAVGLSLTGVWFSKRAGLKGLKHA